MHTLKQYIADKKTLLAEHAHSFLEEKLSMDKTRPFFYHDALKKLMEMIPRGKMLRGVLLLLSYELCGGKLTKHTLNAAVALQLACDGLLIADDFMDNSPTRRGNNSIFTQYKKNSENAKGINPLLYGQSMCVCVSDMTFFFAMELLSLAIDDPKINKRLYIKFAEEFQVVAGGQMLDVHVSMFNEEPSEAEIYSIYKYKTAHYTYVLPLVLGAMAAEAPENKINQLSELGEKLGLIFQIRDDELDLYGDIVLTGKPVGGDIRENKKTLWRSRLYAKVNATERSYLNTCFGQTDLAQTDIAKIKQLTEKYGVRQEIEHEKQTLAQACHKIISKLQCDKYYRDLLSEFVEYNVNRLK